MKLAIPVILAVSVLAAACEGQSRLTATPATAPTSAAPVAQDTSGTSEPTPTGKPAPAPDAGQLAMEKRNPSGTEAPGSSSQASDFRLDLLDGGNIGLSDLRGKIVVLNFWASWCPPCVRELPAFERTWQEYRERGVVFMGVAVSDTPEDARHFAERAGVTYPLGLDTDGLIMSAYRVLSIPTTYIIDRNGNVARKLGGPANEGALRIFLNGQLD